MREFNKALITSILVCGAVGGVFAIGKAFGSEALPSNSTIDCSELSGSPYVCVINHKNVGISGMTCPGWFTNAQNIPGGVIDPGEVAIIKFGSSKCDSGIDITFSDGHKQKIEGFNTDKNTFLHVK